MSDSADKKTAAKKDEWSPGAGIFGYILGISAFGSWFVYAAIRFVRSLLTGEITVKYRSPSDRISYETYYRDADWSEAFHYWLSTSGALLAVSFSGLCATALVLQGIREWKRRRIDGFYAWTCPHCKGQLLLPIEAQGSTVSCDDCGNEFFFNAPELR